MPLPPVKDGEDQSSYVGRCVSFIFSEGTLNGKTMDPKNPKDRKIAVATCYSNYRSKNKSDDIAVKGGLKDSVGYYYKVDGISEKFYYDIADIESKKLAKTKAEEFGLDQILKSYSENCKDCQIEEVIQEVYNKIEPKQDSYMIPKSKDELKSGDIIKYNDKIGKIVKVINK